MTGRSRALIALLILIAATGCPLAAMAHEFWIEPLAYRLDSGGTIEARLKVGQNFSGDNLPWLPQQIAEAGIVDEAGTGALEGMVGDLPAISKAGVRPGLNVLFYYSKPSTLTHASFEKFETFLRDTGQSDLLRVHRERGLPESGFIEAFTRCAKALVQVGDIAGEDRLTDMPLEIHAEANPYRDSLEAIPVRLYWLGKPVAGAQITVFRSGDLHQTMKLRTGPDGRVTVRLSTGGDFLISAVKMIPRNDETDIVWHSYWASLTFGAVD